MSKEYLDDIVYAKFISYMKKALLHKRIDYLRNQDYLRRKEMNISENDCVVLSITDSTMQSFFDFNSNEIRLTRLKYALEKLTKKQQKVIYLNYKKKMTLKSIGKELNISTKAA